MGATEGLGAGVGSWGRWGGHGDMGGATGTLGGWGCLFGGTHMQHSLWGGWFGGTRTPLSFVPPQVFQPPVTLPLGGRFYPPTLVTGVAPTSRCLRELVGAGRQNGEGGWHTLPGGRGCWGAGVGGQLMSCVYVCPPPQAPGPVVALLPVRSPGEAVTVASGLPHVAAGAVWAQDVTLALDVAER